MKIRIPSRLFKHVAFNVQTITARTQRGNVKFVAMIYVFTRYIREKYIPDEKAITIAAVFVEKWNSVFGSIETLMSGGGPSVVGRLVMYQTEMLAIGRTQIHPIHLKSNVTVERLNRTLFRELSRFMDSGYFEWDEHDSLFRFRYNTGAFTETGMNLFKSMYGINVFEIWGEVDLECFEEEPDSL